jgi:hypothetical protein
VACWLQKAFKLQRQSSFRVVYVRGSLTARATLTEWPTQLTRVPIRLDIIDEKLQGLKIS